MSSDRRTRRPGAWRQVVLRVAEGMMLEGLPFPSANLHVNNMQAANRILSELEGSVSVITGELEGENLSNSKRFSKTRKLSKETWEYSEVMESVLAKEYITEYSCFQRFFQKCGQSALVIDPVFANSSIHQNVFVTPQINTHGAFSVMHRHAQGDPELHCRCVCSSLPVSAPRL